VVVVVVVVVVESASDCVSDVRLHDLLVRRGTPALPVFCVLLVGLLLEERAKKTLLRFSYN
jgi:hypothetical protein